jgi:hypothetical protein
MSHHRLVHTRQHVLQGVAELVEERLDLAERHEGRLVADRRRLVAHHLRDGQADGRARGCEQLGAPDDLRSVADEGSGCRVAASGGGELWAACVSMVRACRWHRWHRHGCVRARDIVLETRPPSSAAHLGHPRAPTLLCRARVRVQVEVGHGLAVLLDLQGFGMQD